MSQVANREKTRILTPLLSSNILSRQRSVEKKRKKRNISSATLAKIPPSLLRTQTSSKAGKKEGR